MRALTMDRQALTMARAAVAAQVDEALDVQAHFAAQIAFDTMGAVDDFANLSQFGIGKRIRLLTEINLSFRQDLAGSGSSDAVDIGQSHFHPLIAWEIDSRDTSHCITFFPTFFTTLGNVGDKSANIPNQQPLFNPGAACGAD
jgi:hypothetical protein